MHYSASVGQRTTCAPGAQREEIAVKRNRLFTATALVVACTSFAGTSTAAVARTQHAISSSEISSLKKVVAKESAVPRFVAPGPAFKATSTKGKSVLAVPSSSEIPYCAGIIDSMQSIGKKIGVKVTNYSASGSQAQYQAAATQALAQHVSAFTTICGIDPALITPQIAKLTAAKIPTIALLGDVSAPTPKIVQAGADIQLGLAAKTLVDDAAVQNGGKPFDVLLLTDYDISGSKVPVAAAQAEVKKVCGSACKVTTQSVPITAWGSGIGSTVSTALVRDSKTTAIIPLYDGMVPGLVAAAQNAHRTGLHIYTYGASSGVVKLIESTHGLVAANIGASTPWTAYTQMDQILRVLAGQKPVPASMEYPPLRLWDSSNVKQYFTSNSYGSAFPGDYLKLWGE